MSEIPPLADANVRFAHLLRGPQPMCAVGTVGLSTRLLALAVPHNHETLDGDTQAAADWATLHQTRGNAPR